MPILGLHELMNTLLRYFRWGESQVVSAVASARNLTRPHVPNINIPVPKGAENHSKDEDPTEIW